jgi:hypothetical protein
MDYITTQQLEQEIVKLGFELESTESIVLVKDDLNRKVASIRINEMYAFDTVWDSFREINADTQNQLCNLLDRYARTPLDERELEKRYRLRLDIDDNIYIFDGDYRYLTRKGDYYCLSLPYLSGFWKDYQNTFTQSEIDEMGSLTRGFVKEEVNE